jgi:hypothetical protein
MRTISAIIDIGATPQQAWGALADLDCYPQWNPLIRPAPGGASRGRPSPCWPATPLPELTMTTLLYAGPPPCTPPHEDGEPA